MTTSHLFPNGQMAPVRYVFYLVHAHDPHRELLPLRSTETYRGLAAFLRVGRGWAFPCSRNPGGGKTMTDSIRTAPRWLLTIAICALLMAGFVVGTNSRVNAQDAAATPSAESTKTATATTNESTVTEADTNAEFANGDLVSVLDGPLNLREKAGTSNDVVLKLPTGTPLTITDGP